MNCENCKSDMAQIPYIEHELRMAKAYDREKKLRDKNANLKRLFVASNLLWGCVVVTAVIFFFAR